MLRYVDGSLFLIAREHPRGRLKAFALERLTNIKIENTRYPKDAASGLDDFLKDRLRSHAAHDLEHVTIHIEQSAVWRVTERIWHPSQRVIVDDDGAALVRFRVPGFTWIKAWVLGFGAHAIVLSPPSLVQAVRDELDETRDKYRQRSAHVPQLDLFEQ
jgi:proteasome accessory factor B